MRETNCRTRNTLNALVKKFGMISGRYVFTQPSSLNSRNCGIIVICAGIIMVASTRMNMRFLPGARSRAKA